MNKVNLNFDTYAKQGLVGVGRAIYHYTSLGDVVSIPLTDNQGYDLVVDSKTLKRIQVKTAKTKAKSGNYVVYLRTISGRKVLGFNYEKFDELFILTGGNEVYIIPNVELKNYKNALTLTQKWDCFKYYIQ